MSDFERLQALIMNFHNRNVREWFKDVSDDDLQNYYANPLGTPSSRTMMRALSTAQDDDTATMLLLRMWVFEVLLGHTRSLQTPIYGMPLQEYQQDVIWAHPQVKLFFSQDRASLPDGVPAIEATISFRIMDETSATYTEAKAKLLATKIKAEFGTGGSFVFTKGKTRCGYRDPVKGYDLAIYASTESEGVQVIQKVLDLQNHTYDSDKLTVSVPKKTSVNVSTATELVYGKTKKKRRWKPTGNVRFRWATLSIHNLDKEIWLVDTTGRHIEALAH